MRQRLAVLLLVASWARPALAHDIPNAQVDRSIQATAAPDLLKIDYEVSLAELTLAQDLHALLGTVPAGDRSALLDRYGREIGPLNAKGLQVSVDGRSVDLRFQGFAVAVEEHPRYTFHFEAPLPSRKGVLKIQDLNFISSEGTSRLAIRGVGGLVVRSDALPSDVREIPIRPVWQLSDEEERRTKQVEVEYEVASDVSSAGSSEKEEKQPAVAETSTPPTRSPRLTDLLDRAPRTSAWWLGLIALGLGAVHAIQPGHGKTLVAAVVVGERGGWPKGVLLALTTTIAHIGGVVAIALILNALHSRRYGDVNRALTQSAGFAIAAVGLWRLGTCLAGRSEHEDLVPENIGTESIGNRGILSLGLAGGIIPCWDAIALVVVAGEMGRMDLGLSLLAAFSLGMAGVLTAVGLTAARLRGFVAGRGDRGDGARRLAAASGLALAAIGLALMLYS